MLLIKQPITRAEPLEASALPGCDKSTSRCQTTPSIRALRGHQPVIPGVPLSVERESFHTELPT
eukprot:1195355-Prorocentrum_minimum.AAC.3